MQKIKESNKMNNRGFTLIEMIVTVAIIAIFAGVVLNFITTGSNLFRNTSNTAKVQMETQETFDKIEDIIINSNRKLSYGESSHIFEVASFDEQVAAKSAETSVAARLKAARSGGSDVSSDEENVRDYIIWNQTTEEITYIHSENSDGTWRNSNTSSANPQGDILATGVTYFQADVSKAISDNIVNFVLKTRKGTKGVETVHSVSLRNNLNIDYSPNEPFDNPTMDPVTPAPVSPTPEPVKVKPVSLLSDKKSILIAAGASYDLGGNITWKVIYSDASTSAPGNLSWSVNGCSYASISSEGVLSVNADAGTSETGKITITVTDVDHENVYGTLTVSVARIDLAAPGNGGTYNVGDNKQLKCTYMEGGKVVETLDGNMTSTIVTVSTEQKPRNASDYNADGNFVQNDVGDWRVKAEVNLSARRENYDIVSGIASVTNEFSVSARYTARIVLKNSSGDSDTLVIKNESNTGNYICQVESGEGGFSFKRDQEISGFWENSKINWYLKPEHTYNGIEVTQTGNMNASISVSAEARTGFILCADYIKYTDWTHETEQIRIHAEKEIKVATGIEIVSANGDTVKVTENYEFSINMIVYNSSGNEIKIPVRSDTINDNDITITPDPWAIKYPSEDGEKWYFKTSKPGTQKITVTLRNVPGATIFNSNYGFKKEKAIEVIDTTTARVVAVNNKTSIFPGESTRIYLELLRDGQPIPDKINATWTCEQINGKTIGNISPAYFETAYTNGKENLITVIADPNITQVTTYTITVSYSLYGTTETASINITVTPLTMNLITSATQIYYGEEPVTITADIVDAQRDQHVTDNYDIEWKLNPENAEIYGLDNISGKVTFLSVKKAPDSAKSVTVTAVAKDKNSKAVVCSSSTKITVSPKTTIEKAYNCAANQNQKLEFNDEDRGKTVEKIRSSYLTATADIPVECGKDQLPLLILNDEDISNLSVTMNADTSDYESYKYVLISVDLGDVLYNFYIYPLQNNVYDCEYGQDAGVVPFTYVPTDLESIRRLAVLGSNDNADSSPGYTYTYTDSLKETCYLRLSVYNKTGIGVISDNYVDSSAQKWFMKRKARDKKENDGEDQAFYRLYGNKWYKFHSLGKVTKKDYNNDEALYNKEKAKRTRYYWDLKDNIHLYDDNGKELENQSPVYNIYFWQKWN